MDEILCAKCPFANKERVCMKPDGKNPPFCATKLSPQTTEKAKEIYRSEEVYKFAKEAAIQEGLSAQVVDGVRMQVKPRIVETVEFCRRMGYKHLGLAFCGGLVKEARIVNEILETNGFKVTSAMCKAGGVDKSFLDLTDEQKKNGGGHESMCNNINQALILNEAGTEFNIMLGLCVGHDALFLKQSNAYCTVFASKDRAMGNCPLQPIYLYDSYCSYLKKPLP